MDFANETLFRLLGIAEHESFYAKTAEEHKRFIVDRQPKKTIWLADPQGIAAPG